MSIQLSIAVRNARLSAIPNTIGASAYLEIYSGAMPASCSAAATGTLLAKIPLPATYFAAPASGSMAMTGTWSELSADASGTAGYFRLYDNLIATCHMQGTVTAAGGGGDAIINNTSVTAGQQISVSAFNLTDANA